MNQAMMGAGFFKLNNCYPEDCISSSSSKLTDKKTKSSSNGFPNSTGKIINGRCESDSGRSYNDSDTEKLIRTTIHPHRTASYSRSKSFQNELDVPIKQY